MVAVICADTSAVPGRQFRAKTAALARMQTPQAAAPLLAEEAHV
jgi:hypothetical protein